MRTLKAYLKLAVVVLTALKIIPAYGEVGKFPEFQAANIHGAAGTFSVSNTNFHLSNPAGSNGTFFVFQKFSGNGEISARLRRGAKSPAKVGVIFRQSTNAISQTAGAFLATTNTVFERVLDLKQPPITTIRTNEIFEWLRVVREGNAFSGFHSNDGTNWTQFSADSIEMPNEIFVGFAITGAGEADLENVRMISAHLVNPLQDSMFVLPTNILIEADLTIFGGKVSRAEFFHGTKNIGGRTEFPYSMIFSNALAGPDLITAKIIDEAGAEFFTEPVDCEIKLPPTSATFLQVDATTKGNWKGNFGDQGFVIANHSTNLPAYVQWIPTGFRSHTWVNSSGEERGLLRTDSDKRIASSWFHPKQLEIDLVLADGKPHRFAVYFLDWDRNDRSTLVEVSDASNKKVLDSRTVSSFANGKYLVWSLVGHVKIRISGVRGNASFSGLFFDSEE